MLTGHVPFPGPSLPEKIFSHQAIEPTPLDQLVPGLPEGLSEIVQKMMRKSPDERYATPLQVAQALEPYGGDDHAGVGRREGSPQPQWAEPASRSDDAAQPIETKPVAALVKAVAAPAGRKSSPSVPTTARSEPQAVDPTPPLLTPITGSEEAGEEVLLVLDLDPKLSLSEGQSRPKPRSSQGRPASAAQAAARVGWLAPVWLWGLIVLTVMVTVLILILATANPLGHSSPGPTPGLPMPPTHDGEFRADSDEATKSAAMQRIRFSTLLANLHPVNEWNRIVDVAVDL